MRRQVLLALVSLALVVSGCGRSLAPDRVIGPVRRDGVASTGIEPGAPWVGPAARRTNESPTASFDPPPNRFFPPTLPLTFTAHWTSEDPDGPAPFPRSFRYRVFREDDPDFLTVLVNPAAIEDLYAPDFDGWTEVNGRATGATITGLTEGKSYVLALTSFDQRGNHDAAWSFDKNLMFFHASAAADPAAAGLDIRGRP